VQAPNTANPTLGTITPLPDARPEPLKLVGLETVQHDLFARAVRIAARAKTPSEARKGLEKLGAVFGEDGLSFKLAGLEAKLGGNPALAGKKSAAERRRKSAKAARKARRENRRG